MPRHTQAPHPQLQTTAPALLISELTSPELPVPLQAPDIQTDMEKVPASSTGILFVIILARCVERGYA